MCQWKVNKEDRLCHICKLSACPERKPPARRLGTMMPALRKMNVGEKIELPRDKYDTIRVAASKLNSQWGVRYTVHRKEDSVEVKRIC